ncbi:MAG: VWA domain-containing protein [Bacteroidales bacterium]|nr:VWA domain-containing protein [Bacteroidales bacterium]
MTKKNYFNMIILDESGSMTEIKAATIRGFNEVAQTIRGFEKDFPDQQHFISLVTFNGKSIKTILDQAKASELHEINEETYQPDSFTPLYDAIGLSVLKLDKQLSGYENANVMVTIITDGEENASSEFTGAMAKKIIADHESKGWKFSYIGANHDVEKVAKSLSISNSFEFTCNDESVMAMFEHEKINRIMFAMGNFEKRDKSILNTD